MDTETIEQPRNDAGQFTSSETLTGLAGVEADAGYTQFSTPTQDDPGIEENPEVLRAAFDDAVSRGVDVGEPDYAPDPIVLQDSDGKQLPENVTVTAEQAGAALSGYQHQVGSYVEGMVLDNTIAEIDAARAAVLKSDPSLANEYGLNPEEVAANAAKLEQKTEQTEQSTTDAAKEPEAPVDALEPKLAEALKHPQVRAAVEEEIGKAGQARQQYEAALNFTHALAQQSLVEKLPELAQVPVDQWANAIVQIAQQDPNRVGNALDSIKRVNDLQIAQGQYQQFQVTQQRQQVEAWAKDQSAKHDAWLAQEGIKASELKPFVDPYLESLGTSQEELGQMAQRLPEVRSDLFQRILTNGVRLFAMQNAPKAFAARNLPPVVRPGAAGASRVNDNSSKIASLMAQLDAAPNDHAAARIYQRIAELRGAA
jgi:uncharacterized protein YggL (DUF469 family)